MKFFKYLFIVFGFAVAIPTDVLAKNETMDSKAGGLAGGRAGSIAGGVGGRMAGKEAGRDVARGSRQAEASFRDSSIGLGKAENKQGTERRGPNKHVK